MVGYDFVVFDELRRAIEAGPEMPDQMTRLYKAIGSILASCPPERQIPALVTAANLAHLIFLAHGAEPDDAARWSDDFMQILADVLATDEVH